MTFTLGLNFLHSDASACIFENGLLIAAVEEERFTRKKHDAGFPHHAIQYCLKEAGIAANQIDNVVFYEKPFVKLLLLVQVCKKTYLKLNYF